MFYRTLKLSCLQTLGSSWGSMSAGTAITEEGTCSLKIMPDVEVLQ